MEFIIGLIPLAIAIRVCVGATKLNPVYAMLMAATAGASSILSIIHLWANQPISFLIWAMFALINTVTVARWLAAHAAEFVEHQ